VVDAIELRDEPLAQAQDAGRRGVPDRRRARELDGGVDDVLRRAERRLADLQADASRSDQREIDDLADARVRGLGRTRRDGWKRSSRRVPLLRAGVRGVSFPGRVAYARLVANGLSSERSFVS